MRIVIMDTNAWLDLYTIHPAALKMIVKQISANKNDFWVPEQVYWEFGRHVKGKRETALKVIENASTNARTESENARALVKKELTVLKNNNILSDDSLLVEIEDKYKEIKSKIKYELRNIDEEYKKEMLIISEGSDIVLEMFEEIYSTSNPYVTSAVERIQLYEEGEKRVKYQIPPGLTDTDKEESVIDEIVYRRRYGDFLIWHDILRKTKDLITASKKAEDPIEVVFVENEKKGDWWIKRAEPRIAPELEEEFNSVANGKAKIKMMSFSDFLLTYGKQYAIEETEVGKLVSKIKYYESVCKAIRSDAEKIITEGLIEYFSVAKNAEELFSQKSYIGGVFENVENVYVEPQKIEIQSLEEDESGQILYLLSVVEISFEGDLTEYIDRETNYGEHIKDQMRVRTNFEVIIDYSKGYEEDHYDVAKIKIVRIASRAVNWKKLKDLVFERDGYRCVACGRTLEQGAQLQVDHIYPKSAGGRDTLDNLQTLCASCNCTKSNKILSFTTCPDCGKKIYYWNDGGNGFCIDCAPNH